MKTKIFYFLLGAIIFSSITAIAVTQINASEVSYDETHSVKDKIDDLYTTATTFKNLTTATTATSNDILNGKTAYNNLGQLITGNAVINTDFETAAWFTWTGKAVRSMIVKADGTILNTGTTVEGDKIKIVTTSNYNSISIYAKEAGRFKVSYTDVDALHSNTVEIVNVEKNGLICTGTVVSIGIVQAL